VLAVLDWELSSIGSPIADLAYCCMGHYLPPVGFLKALSLLGRGTNTTATTTVTATATATDVPTSVSMSTTSALMNVSVSEPQSSVSTLSITNSAQLLPEGIPTDHDIVAAYLQASGGNISSNSRSGSNKITVITVAGTGAAAGGAGAGGLLAIDDKHWRYFLALGFFRAAAIAAGVYARSLTGNASRGGEGAMLFKKAVPVLAAKGLELIGQPSSRRIRGDQTAGDAEDENTANSASASSKRTSSTKHSPSSDVFLRCSNGHSIDIGGSGGKQGPSAACQELLSRLREFNDTVAIPAEKQLVEYYTNAPGTWPDRGRKWIVHPLLYELARQARLRGLWNLWIPETL
jgi:hypothetical protein